MYDTILVLLDKSQRAEAILCHVEELAQRYDATVMLVQVVEPAPHSTRLDTCMLSWDQLYDLGISSSRLVKEYDREDRTRRPFL